MNRHHGLLLLLLLLSTPAVADPAAVAAAHWSGCASCHGELGQGLRPKEAPGIAGQDAGYIEGQMRAFRGGIRGAHPEDHAGSQMTLMAAAITDDAVLRALSARIAAMPAQFAAPTLVAGNYARGALLYSSCAVCHGQQGQGGAVAPRLAGIGDWYLLAQLRKYRDGLRGYQPQDVAGRQMAGLAAGLGDSDLQDLTAHLGSLQSTP